MSIISYQDLFDFDGYEKALSKLEGRQARFAQNAANMIGTLEQSYSALVSKVSQLEKEIAGINLGNSGAKKQLTDYGRAVEEFTTRAKRQKETIDLLNGSINLNEKSIKDLRAGLSALKREYEALDPTSADFAQKQKQIVEKAKEVNSVIATQRQVLNSASKAVEHANKSYNQLSQVTNELKTRLKAMPGAFDPVTGSINKHNKAAVEMQRQIQRNDAALKKMDAGMGNYQRNVGNYGSAFQGLGSQMLTAIPAVLGINSAFDALQQSIMVIDRMEKLSLGLQAVTRNTKDFMQRTGFVQGLARQTGQEIEKLTSAYVSFTAAARDTSLEGARGDRVFAAFSKSFAALGTSSETAERGLMAVQQMISKGKVSSEELRQQLGEALPGANKIFADALGVTTAELDGMLKKGEVLSSDVLPKVAAELEKVYGEKAQRNLKTITGSWSNLTNEIKLLLASFNEKGAVSGFFSSISNGIANAMGSARLLMQMRSVTKDEMAQGTRNRQYNTFQGLATAEQAEAIKNQTIVARNALKEFNELQATPYNRERRKELADYAQQQYTILNTFKKIHSEVKALEKSEATPDNDKKKKEVTHWDQLLKSINKVRDALIDDALADVRSGKSISYPPELIEKWKKLYAIIRQVAQATGEDLPRAIEEFNQKIDPTAENIISKVKIEEFKETTVKESKEKPIKDISEYTDMVRGQEDERNLLAAQLSTGTLRKLGSEYKEELTRLLDEIHQLEREGADEQIQQARRVFNEKKRLGDEEKRMRQEVRDRSIELASEAVNGLFEINADYRQQQADWNQKSLQHELAAAGDNEEAKSKIREEFAKRDLEIRKRQAAANKSQALFNIALSTAQAIMNTLANTPPPGNVALSVLVGAIGAVQAATVLAKPLPAFFKGTDYAPEGFATIAEKGPELRESKGRYYYYDTPQITHLEQGDKVFTAQQTTRILAEQALRQDGLIDISQRQANGAATTHSIETGRLQQLRSLAPVPMVDYDRLTRSIIKGLDSRPEITTIIDDKGQRTRHRRQNNIVEYLNETNRLK